MLALALAGCDVTVGDAPSRGSPDGPDLGRSALGQFDAGPDRDGAPSSTADAAVAAAPRDRVEWRHPPPATFGPDGRTADITFEVPPGTRTITLFAQGREDTIYVIERVEDGAGAVWVEAEPPERPIDALDRTLLVFPGPYLSANRVAWGDVVATAMIPNNPSVIPAPGWWRVRLAADPPPPPDETIELIAQLETGPVPARGRLDLHFHFTDAGNWSAESAPDNPDFRQMLNHVTVLLRDVGIDVGQITFRDVPVIRDTIVASRLSRLLALSEHEGGVSIFLVGRIEDERGGPMAGVAGSVPTSSAIIGSGANGIAVARRFAMEPSALAMTVTHEIGHALGLFHTVETGTPYVDQLDDTPEGEASARNVMHPVAGGTAQRFSAEQGRVMRSSRSVDDAAL